MSCDSIHRSPQCAQEYWEDATRGNKSDPIWAFMEQLNHNESGKDLTGLGRWTVMALQGEGVQTCILCGYSP